ncbi:MAG: hypothetical protein GY849_22775 [Deltaproteobacteria bacterium]|nr:hypothetical protein [Deltaproteobacteria bacterium]
MKYYIPLVGVGLAIWGLVTFDWFKVGFGAVLFFGTFLIGYLIDLFKKKGTLKDDKVFSAYRTVSELIRIIRKSIKESGVDMNSPKAKLAQGLFFVGMLDAISQTTNMSDKQFLELFKAVFTDLDYEFEDDYRARILLFHQSLNTEHGAFPAIMKGGELFTKFINGNTMAPIAGGVLIEELIEDPSFPASVEDL